jgi:hypothetical protein
MSVTCLHEIVTVSWRTCRYSPAPSPTERLGRASPSLAKYPKHVTTAADRERDLPAIVERVFDHKCIDCPETVTFPALPGDARCPGCGVDLYLTDDGQVGRYPAPDWEPGGIQGRPSR